MLVVLIGSVASSYAIDLVDTNIVGVVNAGSTDTYAIDDSAGTPYNVTNSTITAEDGRNIDTNQGNTSFYALGSGGIKSMGTAHDISIDSSTVAGSNGGSIINNATASYLRFQSVKGGNGMFLQNVDLSLTNAAIRGGDGGSMDVILARETSVANGGVGIQLLGTSSLTATNATIYGGNGGTIYNLLRSGIVNGGTGIYIDGSVTVDLSLVDTVVMGGNGGVVNKDGPAAYASAGDGVLISGGATVTINGGTYVGGNGGTVDVKQEDGSYISFKKADGSAINIQGSTVTLAGGDYVGGIQLSSGTSTLTLKDTLTSDPSFLQTAGTVNVNEWHDGQLKDVTVQQGIMRFSGTNAFNLDGAFSVAGVSAAAAKAQFNSGLVVKAGGSLDVGLSTTTASEVYTESNSIVRTSFAGSTLGSVSSSGSITLDAGTIWIINDKGDSAIGVGHVFTLAAAMGGPITNNLNPVDVHYVGTNSPAGYYTIITNVSVVGSSVQAVCGVRSMIDSDVDGVDDELEQYLYGTDPLDVDSDDDGLNDGDEINVYGTDPLDPDSDNDGIIDGDEAANGLDPNVSNAGLDSDGDGLDDIEEVNTYGTNPLASDTDGDGLNDHSERSNYATDPLDADSDDDLISDGDEVANRLNPNVSNTGMNSDGDSVLDVDEVNTYGTNPLNEDTDGDGLQDDAEIFTSRTNPTKKDTDGDGLADYTEVVILPTDPLDPDSDDDGLTDGAEINTWGTDPMIADTDGDGLVDAELGKIIAVGGNDYGQTDVPSGLTNVVSVACGGDHSLALLVDGTVVAWGDNSYGQTNVPSTVTNAISVAGGVYHSMALLSAGTVEAWGQGFSGQCAVPVSLTNAIAVAAGYQHSMALRLDGTIVAWGDNSYGQSIIPADLTNVVAIAAGAYHSLALLSDGTVAVWGDDSYGQTDMPAGVTNAIAVAAGYRHSIALLSNGSVIEWGYVGYAGDTVPPASVTNVTAVAAGSGFTLAVLADGTVTGWGTDWWGPLEVPSEVKHPAALSAGNSHVLACLLCDPLDTDTDDDGLLDGQEVNVIGTSPFTPDSDDDQLSDAEETNVYATDPLNPDCDGDFILDGYEINVYGTNPLDSDSDGDGLSDDDELFSDFQIIDLASDWHAAKLDAETHGGHLAVLNSALEWDYARLRLGIPASPSWTSRTLWAGATDENIEGEWEWVTGEAWGFEAWGVGEPNNFGGNEDYLQLWPADKSFKWNDEQDYATGYLLEIPRLATDPNDADTDDDGLSDGDEVNLHGTNPQVVDSDGDELSDGDEVSTSGSNPLDPDTDSDGELDGAEVAMGFSPTNSSSRLNFVGYSDGGMYGLSFMSTTGRIFTVESRDSLTEGDWIEQANLNGTGGLLDLMEPSLTSNRFYRVRVQQN